jgi:hypothetical protein
MTSVMMKGPSQGAESLCVANVEGGLLNIAIVVPTKFLVVTSLPHDNGHYLLLKAVKVDTTSLVGFSLLVELYAWSAKSDVGG